MDERDVADGARTFFLPPGGGEPIETKVVEWVEDGIKVTVTRFLPPVNWSEASKRWKPKILNVGDAWPYPERVQALLECYEWMIVREGDWIGWAD